MLRCRERKRVWEVEEISRRVGQIRPTVFIPGGRHQGTCSHTEGTGYMVYTGRVAKARGSDLKAIFIQNPHKGAVLPGMVT